MLIIWSIILIFLCLLIYANLEIRAYNKLVIGLSKVNQAVHDQINGPNEIITERFQASLSKQFPHRHPHDVAKDILNFLEISGLPIQHVQKQDSIWIVEVKYNNRTISFYLIEGNSSIRLDSCTNIDYICRKMAFKKGLRLKWTQELQ